MWTISPIVTGLISLLLALNTSNLYFSARLETSIKDMYFLNSFGVVHEPSSLIANLKGYFIYVASLSEKLGSN